MVGGCQCVPYLCFIEYPERKKKKNDTSGVALSSPSHRSHHPLNSFKMASATFPLEPKWLLLLSACISGDLAQLKTPSDGSLDNQLLDVACVMGNTAVVEYLLKKERPWTRNSGAPLVRACEQGHLDVIRVLLADSGIDLQEIASWAKWNSDSDKDYQHRKTAAAYLAGLIDEYSRDPVAVRVALRQKSEIQSHYAGSLFALVVFLADGYVRTTPQTPRAPARFFGMVELLPLELQMLVCNRVYGSMRNSVLTR